MSHQEHIQLALSHFTQEQLQEFYIDTAVDLEDQVPDSLENLLKLQSAYWEFTNNSANCDVRTAQSSDDLIDYVNNTLEKVKK